MKVYLVWSIDCFGNVNIDEVFDSDEKAVRYIKSEKEEEIYVEYTIDELEGK